ncbi:MAG: hypothetical protein PHD21_06125 [Flavobacteriales bacterium]|nr:hypothetical protein [Flavobacteriales bacterium]
MIKTAFYKYIFSAILIFACSGIYAQQSEEDIADSSVYTPSLSKAASHYQNMARKKVQYNIDMRGFVSTWGSENTAWGFGVRPEATFAVGKKVDITVGIDVTQTYYNGAAYIPFGAVRGNDDKYRGNTTDAILYVATSYYATKRLTVYGSAFVNLNADGNPFLPSKGFSVGADYRIGRRSSIGFNFTYIDGGMPYYGYGPYGFCSPIGLSDMGYPYL